MFRLKLNNELLTLVLVFSLTFGSFSQIGHYTQFFNVYQYYNPADVGFNNNFRLVLNYRNQWLKINQGIETKGFSFDMPTKAIGLGVNFQSSNAGKLSLEKNNFNIALSKHLQIKPNNWLSFGMQTGLVNFKISNGYQFDSQYSKQLGYDNSINSGEVFSDIKLNHLGLGFGASYRNLNSKWKPKVFLSLNEILVKDKYFNESNVNSRFKHLILSAELNKELKPNLYLIPFLFFDRQSLVNNFLFGSKMNLQIDKNNFEFGTGLRNKDAFFLYGGYGKSAMLVGVSYDANISKLKPATKGIGAFEISLRIQINKNKTLDTSKLETKDALVLDKASVVTVTDTTTKPDSVIKQLVDDKTNNNLKDSLFSNKQSNELEKDVINFNSIDTNQIKNHLIIYFDVDMAVIKPEFKKLLDEFVASIDKTKQYQILVYGHTDSDGDGMYNIHLGQSRALEVQNYLIYKGVKLQDIKPFSYGKSKPVAKNIIEYKYLNRRVEVLIIQ
jgi:type IX secretion system PorP/SprF family membrane protein